MQASFSSKSHVANEYYETVHIIESMSQHAADSIIPIKKSIPGIYVHPLNPFISNTKKAGITVKSSANKVLKNLMVNFDQCAQLFFAIEF